MCHGWERSGKGAIVTKPHARHPSRPRLAPRPSRPRPAPHPSLRQPYFLAAIATAFDCFRRLVTLKSRKIRSTCSA